MVCREIEILLTVPERRPAIDQLFASTSRDVLKRWADALRKLELQRANSAEISQFYSQVEADLFDLVAAIPLFQNSDTQESPNDGFGFNDSSLQGKTPLNKGASGDLRTSEAAEIERSGVPPHNRMDDLVELIELHLNSGRSK